MKLKGKIFSAKDGFIVQAMFILFYVLERVSIFYWLRVWAIRTGERKGKEIFWAQPVFPEIWAVGNALMAVVWMYLLPVIQCRWVYVLVGVYAMLRVFEMFVYQINVLLFHRLKPQFLESADTVVKGSGPINQKDYHIKSSTRTVILLIFNIFEYIVQFAVIYAMVECLSSSSTVHLGLMDSFGLFMNVSELNVPGSESGFLMRVAHVETIVGVFINIICLARFVGILPGIRELGYGNEEDKKESK